MRLLALACVALRIAVAQPPMDAAAHGQRGETLLRQGFPEEALPHLEQAGNVYSQALALMQLNRLPEALQKLLAVYAQRPDDPEVLFHLGECAGKLMQQSFNRLNRLHPDSPRAQELRAQSYLGQGRGDLAEAGFRKALEMNPDLPGAHLALGRILLEGRGDLNGAEKEFRAEAQLRPGDSEAAWRLGSVLLKKGQGREALIALQQSDKLKPDMLETLLDLGKAYAMENQVEQAQKAFERMIAIDDADDLAAAAHLQLSQICRKLGKTAEADRHLKRFRELNPLPKP